VRSLRLKDSSSEGVHADGYSSALPLHRDQSFSSAC
jgi:hypothetical protein